MRAMVLSVILAAAAALAGCQSAKPVADLPVNGSLGVYMPSTEIGNSGVYYRPSANLGF